MYISRVFSKYLSAVMLIVFGLLGFAQANENKSEFILAFRNFLEQKDYNSANFYLSNGYVDINSIDTNQIFYDIYTGGNSLKNFNEIGVLFNYLNQIKPIDCLLYTSPSPRDA